MRTPWFPLLVIAATLASSVAAAHGGAPLPRSGERGSPEPAAAGGPSAARVLPARPREGRSRSELGRLAAPDRAARARLSRRPCRPNASSNVSNRCARTALPALASAVTYALERHRPLPDRASADPRWPLSLLGSFGSTSERAAAVRELLARPSIRDDLAQRRRGCGPGLALFLGRVARELEPDDPRHAEILACLRSCARASSPATRKVALLEVARAGRGGPEHAAIRKQLEFHAEGGPFVTRPFARHALRELIVPAPEPIVDVGRLLEIADDRRRPLAARVDAVRRLGRIGPTAEEWEFRWVLPWLAGARHPEIDRRVAER